MLKITYKHRRNGNVDSVQWGDSRGFHQPLKQWVKEFKGIYADDYYVVSISGTNQTIYVGHKDVN